MLETEEEEEKDLCHKPFLISIRITSASTYPENYFPCLDKQSK